jgi:hypothetical protein
MKIASRKTISTVALLLGVTFVSPVKAADTSLPISPDAPSLSSPPSGSAPTTASAPAADPFAPSPVGDASSALKNHDKEKMANLEDKVTDSVKNVVKQFASTDSVNLEDLNTARQAVAKLEVLIDIEKHLADLDKIRSERNENKSLSSSIPASALVPPSSIMPAGAPPMGFTPSTPDQMAFMPPVSHHVEVSRVIGVNGRFTAVIEDKSYNIGDTLPNGSTVVGISAREVELKEKGGEIKTLHIKGVTQIYGNTL